MKVCRNMTVTIARHGVVTGNFLLFQNEYFIRKPTLIKTIFFFSDLLLQVKHRAAVSVYDNGVRHRGGEQET